MSTMPTVVVRKGGFLSALFHGLFLFLTAVVVCACALGFYALRIVDETAGDLFAVGRNVLSDLPRWQQALPPALAEALNDHRAADYRDQVKVSARLVPSARDVDREFTVIEIANNGPETITVLALNVVYEDEHGVPVRELRTYAATPLACNEGDWRGPLLPGSKRKFAERCWGRDGGSQVTVEVAELRIWNGPQEPAGTDESTGDEPR